LQNADGGWGQELGRESDAYSTGVSLILLQESAEYDKFGAFNASWYQRGIEYLIDTQNRDGSWHVSSRATPVQQYFDNGDPHETDQFISMQATAWSIAALANAHYHQRSPLTSPIRNGDTARFGPGE
jgi:N-acyl-D-amino-acid deacylase